MTAAKKLSIVHVQTTNIQPKENVTYTKQTQTTSTGTHEIRDGEYKKHILAAFKFFQEFFFVKHK